MSRRVLVVVPIPRVSAELDHPRSDDERRLVASFTLSTTPGAPEIERAGSLPALPDAVGEDPFVTGFAAVCRHSHRELPAGLRIRASTRTPIVEHYDLSAAAVVAGVTAANALLGLALTEQVLDDILARTTPTGIATARAAWSAHSIALRHDCDDVPDIATARAASGS